MRFRGIFSSGYETVQHCRSEMISRSTSMPRVEYSATNYAKDDMDETRHDALQRSLN
jgi:hypothetical protein